MPGADGRGPEARPASPGARLVIATHNRKKLVELRTILGGAGVDLPDGELVTSGEIGAPEPVEDGVTFAANALIKARAVCAATGLAAVADDSGLAVDVLGGSPGIFSARWAGRHGDDRANLDLLLAQLADVRPEHRTAGFVCAAALVTPDGTEEVRTGEMRGVLTGAPRGANGFGYDPVLVPDEQPASSDGVPGTRTAAELDPHEKNAISHRGKAFRALAPLVVRALSRA
ncbi:RdgB/HAM1 family non-canonical purine NTP pyrophosphatase [Myceligenerans indicum]|uniref:dITP/XTP pyrophosphatase n=1 Tax=Myceligenerans indicum TaxID=2593663 RepID=A0ABS1LHP0_9MICO|nr:RdgB/HAM1 family non-canonical purine NTP pyrophosphatase [Myceligenerans indicum]MBL0885092.1 RdgB/HAM1 family non-canonical purine NTP pyrophosphatase [Myceligenerans indicum]